jgi:hypothetical protein
MRITELCTIAVLSGSLNSVAGAEWKDEIRASWVVFSGADVIALLDGMRGTVFNGAIDDTCWTFMWDAGIDQLEVWEEASKKTDLVQSVSNNVVTFEADFNQGVPATTGTISVDASDYLELKYSLPAYVSYAITINPGDGSVVNLKSCLCTTAGGGAQEPLCTNQQCNDTVDCAGAPGGASRFCNWRARSHTSCQ